MILRRAKVMIKNPKYSSDNADQIKKEFMISKLPDSLLTKILSMLPEVDANQTDHISKGLTISSTEDDNIETNNESISEINTCLSDSKIFTSTFRTMRVC